MPRRLKRKDMVLEAPPEGSQQAKMVEEIYKNYGRYLRGIILANVRNRTEADDIFQQFFLSLLQQHLQQDVQNMGTYSCRAVKNDIIDLMRSNKAYATHLVKYHELRSKQAYRTENDPVAVLAKKERAKRLFRFIRSRLPHHEREVVLRRHWYGEPIAQIAESMKINRRSVSRYLCTGTKKLREVFGSFGGHHKSALQRADDFMEFSKKCEPVRKRR